MKLTIKNYLVLTIAVISLNACKKDPAVTPETNSTSQTSLNIEFENTFGDAGLTMGDIIYTNASGESLTITKFNYYISNIKLTTSNGATYTEANSYHLVKQGEEASYLLKLANVPAGNYTTLTFTVGVDSLHNVSGAQGGALDPANGMFWSWNSGYIMSKLEGTSPASTDSSGNFVYHIGGFKGEYSAIRTITFTLPTQAMVSTKITPEIHMKADAAVWMNGLNKISIAATSAIHMPGAVAKSVADNYATAFSVEHVHND